MPMRLLPPYPGSESDHIYHFFSRQKANDKGDLKDTDFKRSANRPDNPGLSCWRGGEEYVLAKISRDGYRGIAVAKTGDILGDGFKLVPDDNSAEGNTHVDLFCPTCTIAGNGSGGCYSGNYGCLARRTFRAAARRFSSRSSFRAGTC